MAVHTQRGTVLDFLGPLGLMLPITAGDVRQAYITRVTAAHPDAGGSVARFRELRRAYELALDYAGSHDIAWLAPSVESYAAQRKVIDAVKRLGGQAIVERSDWRQRGVGEDFAVIFQRLVGMELRGPEVDDAVVRELLPGGRALASLRWLKLSECRVTDVGLREVLYRIPSLQQVRLHRMRLNWWRRLMLRRSFPRLFLIVQ